MPLTHVCVWDRHIGFRRVSVAEAGKMFPHGASARSGYFVCELCAANVLLTASGGLKIQHFRHDPAAPNKECDERQSSFDPTYGRALRGLNSHVMPLRIVINGSSFLLQLGFFYPPDDKAHCEKIKIATDSHGSFEYRFDRIERIGTTYLNVGSKPSRVYCIAYENANAELKRFWADKVTGVSASGSFFDARTGHILLPGAKAFSGNSYYLLQRSPLHLYGDLESTEICRVRSDGFSNWYLYEIKIKRFTATAAKFFLGYSIFLTEKTTKFYPIWPAYVSDPYFIYHNSSSFYFYLCGDDAELKSYPVAPNVLGTRDGRLYQLFTREREQLISLGKAGALGFAYLIKQSLNKKAPIPRLVICDLFEEELHEDIYSKIPHSKCILIESQYDGKVIVRKKGKIERVYRISPEQKTVIEKLSVGTEISFYQGCDCIRTIRFVLPDKDLHITSSDVDLVEILKACSDPVVPASHSLGVLASKYDTYPKTRQWINKAMRSGVISRKALRILKVNIPNYNRRDTDG